MMGLSPFSLDEEPESEDSEASSSVAVAVEDATPEPAEPAEPAEQPEPVIDPVASHIAAKRRELALKTQRLQLDELDWDIPDDKLPRATPGPAGSTPAWDESELEEEIAAANAARSELEERHTPESSADAGLLAEGGDAGTLLFSADTMNKMRAAAAAQTLEPSQFTADQLAEDVAESPTGRVVPSRTADVTPSGGAAAADDRPGNREAAAEGESAKGEAGEEGGDVTPPPPPVSGDSPVVGGVSTSSGTLIMSANEVSAAAAAAVGMAASDVPELADSAPASSYATTGASTESTATPGRAAAGGAAPSGPPAGDLPSGPPPATVPQALALDAPNALPDTDATELPRAKEFPVVPVAIGVTVLLLLVAVVLFLLIR